MHAFTADEISDGALIVERGVDRSIRPCARDVREDTFCAATLVQVIVNERYANGYESSRGSTKAIVGLPRYERATRWRSAAVVCEIASSVRER